MVTQALPKNKIAQNINKHAFISVNPKKHEAVKPTSIKVTARKIVWGGQALCHPQLSETTTEPAHIAEPANPANTPNNIFVPYLLEGEQAHVRLLNSHKKWAEGEIQSIEVISEKRIPALCQHFASCGGCDFQHLSYANQVLMKKEWLEEKLNHFQTKLENISNLSPKNSMAAWKKNLSFISCDPEKTWHYRSRTTLHYHFESESWVYFKKKSKHGVAIQECPLLSPNLEAFIKSASKSKKDFLDFLLSLYFPKFKKGLSLLDFEFYDLEGLEIAGQNLWQKQVQQSQLPIENLPSFCKSLFVLPKPHPDLFFTQIHQDMNQVLQKEIWTILQKISRSDSKSESLKNPSKPKKFLVYEFFAGRDNFLGQFLKSQDAEFIQFHYEENQAAVKIAQNKFEQTFYPFKKKHQRFFAAEEFGVSLKRLDSEFKQQSADFNKVDFVLLDPPRQGLDSQTWHYLHFWKKVEHIVYISCDLSNGLRDLFEFCRLGFSLDSVSALDLFPQTAHFETVFCLSRNIK